MQNNAYSLLEWNAQVMVEFETMRLCPTLNLLSKTSPMQQGGFFKDHNTNDDMMKEVVDTIVDGRRSNIQRIRHSPALQAIFTGCVGEMGDCGIADSLNELKNMSSSSSLQLCA